MDWVNCLLFFVVFLFFGSLYMIYRNEQVYNLSKKVNDLVFLNNMLRISKGEKHPRFDIETMLPSYDRMVLHVKPVRWFFKPPEGFLLEFSDADVALLEEAKEPFSYCAIKRSLADIKR